MAKHKILLAEDDEATRKGLALFLQSEGYDVTEAVDGTEAIRKFRHERFDLVLSDDQMPLTDGMGLLKVVKQLRADCPFILMTAYATMQVGSEAMRLGADAFVAKPAQISELGKKVKDCLGIAPGDTGEERLPPALDAAVPSEQTSSQMMVGTLLTMILHWIRAAARVRRGEIWLGEENEALLYRRAVIRPEGAPEPPLTISRRSEKDVVAAAFRSGQSVEHPRELAVVFGEGVPVGAIHLVRAESDPPFADADLALTARLADSAAVAVRVARAHEDLRRTKEDMDRVLACMSDALLVMDARGAIRRVNRAAAELLGYSEEELAGLPLRKVLDTGRLKGDWMPRLLKGEALYDHELGMVKKDGTAVTVRSNASAMRRDGALQGIVLVCRK